MKTAILSVRRAGAKVLVRARQVGGGAYNAAITSLPEDSVRKTRISALLLSLTTLVGAQAGNPVSGEYQPRGSIREYFLGAWKLVATENKYPDGHTGAFPDLGPDAVGFLMYTASGHMCAQLMKPGRSSWNDVGHPTAAESASALDGFTSYCGIFEIRENERTIIHRPQTAWAPNWVGSEQRRPYHLVNQDRFFFRGVEKEKQKDGLEIPVTWTITWERLK